MDLVLYKDKNFKDPFSIENLGDIVAGDTKVIEGYLYNTTVDDIVKIQYEVPDTDIQLIDVPDSLQGESWQKIQIKYSPRKVRTTPLNTFVTFSGLRKIRPE